APAEGAPAVAVYLRGIEGALARGHDVGDAGRLDGPPELRLGVVPVVRVADELLGTGGQLGLELVEAVVPQQAEHEGQQALQLVAELLLRAEDVRVVLRE